MKKRTPVLTWLAENLNFMGFCGGFALLYAGLAAVSVPVANIVAGGLVMAVSAWPYLRVRKP